MPRGGYRAGSGKKKGSKHKKTLEREAARKAYEQMVLENLRPLFQRQLLLANGVNYVYRIDRHERKGQPVRIEHVLLESPSEIADALDLIMNEDFQDPHETGFYYVTTKAPEGRAIDSMLDRSIGKPAQPISGDKDNPLEVVNIVKYAKGANPSA